MKRTLKIVLIAAIVLSLAVTSAFIIIKSDHDCYGEDCTVCHLLRDAVTVFRYSLIAASSVTLAFCIPPRFASSARALSFSSANTSSLVFLKVKLND